MHIAHCQPVGLAGEPKGAPQTVDDVQLHLMTQTKLKKSGRGGAATGNVYQVIICEVGTCAHRSPTAITFSPLSNFRFFVEAVLRPFLQQTKSRLPRPAR
jgi:hypothetical protein